MLLYIFLFFQIRPSMTFSTHQVAIATAACMLVASEPCEAITSTSGQVLFERAGCVGCHPGGSNVVGYARAKTLKLAALEKNGYSQKEDIVNLIVNGKRIMPPFSEYTRKADGALIPARLSSEEIEAVAEYVLDEAQSGWSAQR